MWMLAGTHRQIWQKTSSLMSKAAIDPSHKSHYTSAKYTTMHHFETEICTVVHISVTKWYIVGYETGGLWDLCNRSRSTSEAHFSMYMHWSVKWVIIDQWSESSFGFRWCLAAYSSPSHYLNQCWIDLLHNNFSPSSEQHERCKLAHEL